MIEEIIQDLKKLSSEQLEEIHRVIQIHTSSFLKNEIDRDKLHYLGKFLGIDWDEHGQAFMQLGPYNNNIYDVTQGGALFTLADVAIGFEILKQLHEDEHVFTLELKTNFIKMGTGDKLLTNVEFLQWGKKIVVAQCKIIDHADETIAHALGTFYIKKR